MDKDEIIKFLIKQNDFILNVNRTLKLKNFIKDIGIVGYILLNFYLFKVYMFLSRYYLLKFEI